MIFTDFHFRVPKEIQLSKFPLKNFTLTLSHAQEADFVS